MLERRRQFITGVVVSDKMDKTRVVVVKKAKVDRLYHKVVQRDRRFYVHDERNESREGDTIMAISCRPLSKNKHFRMTKVVEKRKLI